MKEIKIQIPEGMQAEQITTDDGMLIRFCKEKFEPKNGDVCAIDFTSPFRQKRVIFMLKEIIRIGNDGVRFYFGINGGDEFSIDGTFGYQFGDKMRPATPEEKQILFDALKKEGKKWNAEKKCIEDIEDVVLVPDNIYIVQDICGLNIRKDNQLLCYSIENNWAVFVTGDDPRWRERAKCKLVKCKWDYLEVGDVFYSSINGLDRIDCMSNYRLKISGSSYSYWDGDSVIVAVSDSSEHYYKVVPL